MTAAKYFLRWYWYKYASLCIIGKAEAVWWQLQVIKILPRPITTTRHYLAQQHRRQLVIPLTRYILPMSMDVWWLWQPHQRYVCPVVCASSLEGFISNHSDTDKM